MGPTTLTEEIKKKKDHGQHYRALYRIKISEHDIKRGFIDIKLDPFRIASILNMTSFAMQTILKKCAFAGMRGHKDYKQDLNDIICAAERELEIITEDEVNKL